MSKTPPRLSHPTEQPLAAMQALVDALRESLRLVEEAGTVSGRLHKPAEDAHQEPGRAKSVPLTDSAQEPIRTIHQFACSGGTLICKCVAAMPNVQLLSEVDPLYPGPLTDPDKPRFTPSDMPALLRSSTRGTSESLIAKVFQAGLQVVHEHSVARGLRLVLRDHAHTHYCRGNVVPARPTLRELVSGVAPVVSVITVRHPVDSFVSLRSNEWLHFSPPNFETYCQRYLKFLDDHAGVPVVRYEDLVADPASAMQRICHILELPYADGFASLFSAFRITGDSGRSGEEIAMRPRRTDALAIMSEANEISAYGLLASRLGYDVPDALQHGSA